MALDDGNANCILAVCCPPGSPGQRQTLALEVEQGVYGIGKPQALAVADWILETFDLAPHGSLTAFKSEVARLARGRGPKE